MHTVQTYKSNNEQKRSWRIFAFITKYTTHGPTDYLVHYSIQLFLGLTRHTHTAHEAESDDWQVFDEKKTLTVKQSLSFSHKQRSMIFGRYVWHKRRVQKRPTTRLVKLLICSTPNLQNVISILWPKKVSTKMSPSYKSRNIKIDDYVRIYASITFVFHFYVPKPSRWLGPLSI